MLQLLQSAPKAPLSTGECTFLAARLDIQHHHLPLRVFEVPQNLHTANIARGTRSVSCSQKKDAQVLQHAPGTEPARRLLLRALCWWQHALQTLQMR